MATTKTISKSRLRAMGKRQRANLEAMTHDRLEPQAAIKKLRDFKPPKFDQTVEVCFYLGIDPKQADQAIRGSVALPAGIGQSKRVVAFCPDEKVKDALAAGAVKAGGEQLVAEVNKGWMDFDVAVADPSMMRVVSPLGRVLGPKGLMPSPKAGTVTKDVAQAVAEYAAGKVEYRNDKLGNIHAPVGKWSFSDEDLLKNLTHMISVIDKARPSSVKGMYVKKIAISGTMTPSVLVAHTASE